MSALLSASETALTGSSKPRIHQLVKKGDTKAGIVERLQSTMDSVIGSILLGNTLLNILASSLITGALVQIFGDTGMVYATIGMTFLILLFAEVMPKVYAVRYPEKTALFLVSLVAILIKILKPITQFVQWLAYEIWRFIGVNIKEDKANSDYEEDLRGAIDLHRGQEPETDEERRMLNSILDLNATNVDEILIHRKDMTTIDINQETDKIISEIIASPYTRYPVWENDSENIIGILHTRDVLKALKAYDGASENINLKSLLSKPWFIPKTTSLFDQLQAFRKRHEHIALVIDEYGSLHGIITLEDILEEIVGEITDEHDPKNQIAFPRDDGGFEVKGHTTLRDLNRQFDWNLPDDKATTVAGLVLYASRRIPKSGQEINIHGFKVLIQERQRNQITQLVIYPPQNDTVATTTAR